jgi:SAM-dependent methyltransferase
MNTTDDKTYYKRTGDNKAKIVFDFIKNKNDIGFIYDVGCNNGNISYPLQIELNKKVLGVDLSDDLAIPDNYNFIKKDIVNSCDVVFNDCTLFFSMYHHILGKYGLEIADDIFLKLLLRTNYLLFDTGNLSERNRKLNYWYKEQLKHFKSEKDLLDHFGLPYTVLGTWRTGGGTRSVVVFHKQSFDSAVKETGTFKRRIYSAHQKMGLIEYELANNKGFYEGAVYKKLNWNNKILFSKKRKQPHLYIEAIETKNIVTAYSNVDKSLLISFYGLSDKYGLIFEWIDDFQYINRQRIKVGKITLKDVDLIELKDGTRKYIDFER